MDVLDRYRVNHLILLVGGNPLPNVVAALLLAHDANTRVSLIATPATGQKHGPCDRLAGLLHEKGFTNIIRTLMPSVSPVEVDLAVRSCVATDIERSRGVEAARGRSTIGLHYTGGTKSMAVHAYLTLRDLAQDMPGADVQYSYLDADTLALQIKGAGIDGTELVRDTWTLVSVSLFDLLKLHGLADLRQQMVNRTIWHETQDTLASVATDKQDLATWREWVSHTFQDVGRRAAEIAVVPISEIKPERVRTALLADCSGCQTLGDLALAGDLRTTEQLQKWLAGTWLEQYTYRRLAPLEQSGLIRDLYMTINPYLSKKGRASPDFELDIACVRGYQLFGISCTASASSRDRKLHLLEAVVRTEQLGGGEAEVAIVCLSNAPDDLQAQVSSLFRGRRVRVFGSAHLAHLTEHLHDWVCGVGNGR